MSSTTTFRISLDHLTALRHALAELETTLGTAHAHHWPTIDPTLHLGPTAWRVEKGDTATYVYGLLNEASPLGDTHADVVRRLEDWYHHIHETVTAMTTYAEQTHATYSAADEAIAAAAMRVAGEVGGGSGGGAGSGSTAAAGSGSASAAGSGSPGAAEAGSGSASAAAAGPGSDSDSFGSTGPETGTP